MNCEGQARSPAAMNLSQVVSVLLAVTSLAGCAAQAPERRTVPAPAADAPERRTVPAPAADAPESRTVPARLLDTQPAPIDVAVPSAEYPRAALDANFEGFAVLKILIAETGRVREAKVLKDPGYGLGDAAARSALAHFRFSPARLQGQPVATWWTFTVMYVLPRR